jgi:uncharacterized iron-regulated membrane protein
MKLPLLNRRVHYWLTLLVTVPLLVVVTTGVMLQLKKQWGWVQPPEKKGGSKVPSVSWETMLSKVREHPQFSTADWENIKRIDVRPSKGMAKLTLDGDWEVQLDTQSGEVLQVAIRRSDWIESLHDGSFFAGDVSKLGFFLPAAVGLLVMLLSGVWMFWQPFGAKWRKRRRSSHSVP